MQEYLMKIKFIIIFGLIISGTVSAQNQISLLDAENVKEYLTISSEQYKTIIPLIKQIKSLLEADKKIIGVLKERITMRMRV